MYVHPDARGAGVAAALIDAVVAWAAAEGATELVLSVKRANAVARRAYLRHGFVDHGEDGDEPDEQRLRRRL
jgi:GNAT superfamily N-acetyltransferase